MLKGGVNMEIGSRRARSFGVPLYKTRWRGDDYMYIHLVESRKLEVCMKSGRCRFEEVKRCMLRRRGVGDADG